MLVTELPWETPDAQETAPCLRRFLPPFQKLGRIFHRQFKGVHQSVSGPKMDARHEYSSSVRNQRDRGKRRKQQRTPSSREREGGDGDGRWQTRSPHLFTPSLPTHPLPAMSTHDKRVDKLGRRLKKATTHLQNAADLNILQDLLEGGTEK